LRWGIRARHPFLTARVFFPSPALQPELPRDSSRGSEPTLSGPMFFVNVFVGAVLACGVPFSYRFFSPLRAAPLLKNLFTVGNIYHSRAFAFFLCRDDFCVLSTYSRVFSPAKLIFSCLCERMSWDFSSFCRRPRRAVSHFFFFPSVRPIPTARTLHAATLSLIDCPDRSLFRLSPRYFSVLPASDWLYMLIP